MANKIRAIRAKRGYSQVELAEKSGIDQSLISLYERDLGNPTKDTLEKIANALSVKIGDLFFSITPGKSDDSIREVTQEGSDYHPVEALIPFLGRIVANPNGKEYFDNDVPENAVVPFFHDRRRKFFALEVESNSLMTLDPDPIYPGDICVFDGSKQPKNGDVVAVHLAQSNQRMVKVLYHKSGDDIELRSANKFANYPSIHLKKDDVVSYGVFVAKLKISDELKREYGLKK